MAKATTPAEFSIEPEAAAPEAPAFEPSIEPEAAPEASIVIIEVQRLLQLIDEIEASRFTPFDALRRRLEDWQDLTLVEEGPHIVCTMAGVTARCAGDGRAALNAWANAARRTLQKVGM